MENTLVVFGPSTVIIDWLEEQMPHVEANLVVKGSHRHVEECDGHAYQCQCPIFQTHSGVLWIKFTADQVTERVAFKLRFGL